MSKGVNFTGDVARDMAFAHLARQADRYPNLDLKPMELPANLDARDAGLAHLIVDQATRRLLTLAHVIETRLDQPWSELEGPMKGVLLGGATQLLLLDRVPAYAAINHAVEWAKRNIRVGAGGMVNAVLRRIADLRASLASAERATGEPVPGRAPGQTPAGSPISEGSGVEGSLSQSVDHELRVKWSGFGAASPEGVASVAGVGGRDELLGEDGRSVRLRDGVLPDEPLARLAVNTSHARSLVSAWAERYDRATLQALLVHSVARPPVVLNTQHAAQATLERADLLQRHAVAGHHVLLGAMGQLVDLMRDDLGVWVQDASSARAVRGLVEALSRRSDAFEPELVVDFCAGQGTKTRQLAWAFPRARVLATDTDARRRSVLGETFAGGGHEWGGGISVLPPEDVLMNHRGTADVVLVDVPCSNTGVLARRPEAKYRYDSKTLSQLVEVQRAILTQAREVLSDKPGATILYATCSVESAENGEQARWAAQGLGLRIEAEGGSMPRGAPGGEARDYEDGSYWAVLRRR